MVTGNTMRSLFRTYYGVRLERSLSFNEFPVWYAGGISQLVPRGGMSYFFVLERISHSQGIFYYLFNRNVHTFLEIYLVC